MSVRLPAGEYDAKTLVRYAMVATEDEFKTEYATPITRQLLNVFRELRELEGPQSSKPLTPGEILLRIVAKP